eukprot:3626652-Amphidinium_carterae.1
MSMTWCSSAVNSSYTKRQLWKVWRVQNTTRDLGADNPWVSWRNLAQKNIYGAEVGGSSPQAMKDIHAAARKML